MAKIVTEGAIHADEMPPEQTTEQPVAAAQPEPAAKPKPEAASKNYAGGKFNSSADMEKGYLELQNKLSAQGAELGEVRKYAQAIAEQAQQQSQQSAQAPAEPATDYEQMLADISRAVDDGDMEPGEAILKSNAITAQMVQGQAQQQINGVLDQATQQFESTLADRDQQSMVDKFNEQNPDFQQLLESGALEPFKQANPMHDDFSAYYAAKADAAFSQGQAEQAKIKAGSEDAGKVLSEPGTAMQTPKKKPTGEAAIKASMLAAFDE